VKLAIKTQADLQQLLERNITLSNVGFGTEIILKKWNWLWLCWTAKPLFSPWTIKTLWKCKGNSSSLH